MAVAPGSGRNRGDEHGKNDEIDETTHADDNQNKPAILDLERPEYP
jgi:hypothetical protein